LSVECTSHIAFFLLAGRLPERLLQPVFPHIAHQVLVVSNNFGHNTINPVHGLLCTQAQEKIRKQGQGQNA